MRVLHIVSSINEFTGGPARSVTSLSRFLNSNGIDSHILTQNYDNLGAQVGGTNLSFTSIEAGTLAKKFKGYSKEYAGKLNKIVASFDLIHSHGLWMYPNYCARCFAKKYSRPLVVSPRGMLDRWALNQSKVLKKIAWSLYEKNNLKSANVLHATSNAEYSGIRSLGLTNPVAILPNGIDLDSVHTECSFEMRERNGKNIILFISRIHEKKGLDLLVESWAALSTYHQKWQIILAGPVDDKGYKESLEKKVHDRGLAASMLFVGNVEGEDKNDLYNSAKIMVLPSFSENFGIVVLEALAFGVPVITTKFTPWEEIENHDCGWWIELGGDELTKTLASAMNLNSSKWTEMSENARTLASKYEWVEIAENMTLLYRWILGQCDKPDFVRLD